MDRRIVLDKLESLRRCVHRIETKRPDSVEALRESHDLQDILSVNLTRAVQVCVDIAAHLVAGLDVAAPETMAESFDALHEAGVLARDVADRMIAAVGFRNVSVHAYQSIEWAIVYRIAHDHLGDFQAFAEAVLAATDAS